MTVRDAILWKTFKLKLEASQHCHLEIQNNYSGVILINSCPRYTSRSALVMFWVIFFKASPWPLIFSCFTSKFVTKYDSMRFQDSILSALQDRFGVFFVFCLVFQVSIYRCVLNARSTFDICFRFYARNLKKGLKKVLRFSSLQFQLFIYRCIFNSYADLDVRQN